MSNQELFDARFIEPEPRNRRLYSLAKSPFKWLWNGIAFIVSPWLWALPVAMFLSMVVLVMKYHHTPPSFGIGTVLHNIFSVGLVWTLYIGALFAVVKLVSAVFNR